MSGRESVTPSTKAAKGSPTARGLFSGFVGPAPYRAWLKRADTATDRAIFFVLGLPAGGALTIFLLILAGRS